MPQRYCYKSEHASNISLMFYMMTCTVLRMCTLHVQYSFMQYQHNVLYFFVGWPVRSFFHLPSIVLIDVWMILPLWPISPSIFTFISHIFSLNFSAHWSSLFFWIFYPLSSSLSLPKISFFQSVLGNGFCKFSKDGSQIYDTDVVIYEKQDGGPKDVSPVSISNEGVTDPDEFYHCLHGVDHNHGFRSDTILEKGW